MGEVFTLIIIQKSGGIFLYLYIIVQKVVVVRKEFKLCTVSYNTGCNTVLDDL